MYASWLGSSIFIVRSVVADIYSLTASYGQTGVPLDSPEWQHRWGEVR